MERLKVKEPVRLRSKHLAGGNESLYLDIYVSGRRSYEFLKLYLIPERTREDRRRNASTLAMANTLKNRRVEEIQGRRSGAPVARARVKLLEYAATLAAKRKPRRAAQWRAALEHIRSYAPSDIALADVDAEWVEGLRRHVSLATVGTGTAARPLKGSSRNLYLCVARCVFNQAVKDGLLVRSPMSSVERFKEGESVREYLTLDELRTLASAPCADETMRRAFLFSCLTGMRWSDITSMTWEDVSPDGSRVTFRQRKTGGLEYLDIPLQAVPLMGERGTGAVFGEFMNHASLCYGIKAWVSAAGIRKKITFHCARHTFKELNSLLFTCWFTSTYRFDNLCG